MGELLDQMAPMEQGAVPTYRNLWFDEEVKNALKKRDVLYQRARYLEDGFSWTLYRRQRNVVCYLIRKKKKTIF